MSSSFSGTVADCPTPDTDSLQNDIRRTKRLLRRAIATSHGQHRIRLQRELAALEDYERAKH